MKKAERNKKIGLFFTALIILLATRSFFLNKVYGKTTLVENKKALMLYRKADGYYNAGDLESALSGVKFILNNYPLQKTFSSDVYYLYGKILYKYRDFFMAKPYFQRIIYENPDYKKIYDVIFYMARCDFNLKNYRRSIRDFDFLLKKTEKGTGLNDRSLIYLTLSYAAYQKVKEANKLFNEDSVKAILKKIEYLKKRGNYFKSVYLNYLINRNNLSAALIILNNKNLFYPKKKDLCYKSYFEGLVFLKEKKYATAQNLFANSSKYCSDYYYHSSALYYGISLVKQNNPAGLKYVKQESLEIDYPKIKLSALKFLAEFYKKNKKYETHLEYLKRILFSCRYLLPEKDTAIYEKSASNLLFKIIKNMYKHNDLKNPFKIMKKMEFLIPDKFINPEIYLYLAKIKLKENNKKGALVYAKKYYDLSKNINGFSLILGSKLFLAEIYYKNGEYKKSLPLINRIPVEKVKKNKLKRRIINLKLKLYKKLNYKNRLINLLRRSVSISSRKEKIKNLYLLALYEYNQNNTKTAYAYFNDVVKNGYSKKKGYENILYNTYYYLGIINYKFYNYKASLLDFKKGYALDKSGRHFQYELSQIAFIYLKYLNNRTQALKYYEKLNLTAVSGIYKSLAASMISAVNLQK